MLQTAISNATKLCEGAWRAPLTPADVDRLGRSVGREPGPSVVFASDVSEAPDQSTIMFPLDAAAVVNRGTLDDALIVVRGQADAQDDTGTEFEAGDKAFLDEAAASGEDVSEFAKRMLEAVRKLDPDGRMVAFPHRRFINKPDNFVVLVPQPRVRELKVIVRGSPYEFHDAPADLKRDQHGYSTFKIKNATDLARGIALLQQVRRK